MQSSNCPTIRKDSVKPHPASAEGFPHVTQLWKDCSGLDLPHVALKPKSIISKHSSWFFVPHFQFGAALSTSPFLFAFELGYAWQQWTWLSRSTTQEPNASSFPSQELVPYFPTVPPSHLMPEFLTLDGQLACCTVKAECQPDLRLPCVLLWGICGASSS